MSRYTSIIILLVFAEYLFAQNHDWLSITNMNNIQDLAFRNGTIWAATDGGAFSYDPEDETRINFTNTEGLKSVNLSAVAVNNQGRVIFGSVDGHLQVYNPDNGQWDNIQFDGSEINALESVSDTLWATSGAGVAIFVWKDGSYIYRDFFSNFPVLLNRINDIKIFDGKVWLATNNGLLFAPYNLTLEDPQNWSVYTASDGLPADEVLSLTIFSDRLWIGCNRGLASLTNILSLEIATGASGLAINKLGQTSGYLLLAAGTNLYVYSPESGIVAEYNYAANINCLLTDSSNVIWVGLSRGLLGGSPVKHLLSNSPPQSQIRSIARDSRGRIWGTTAKYGRLTPSQGIFFYEDDTWTSIGFSESGWNRLGSALGVYLDRFENMWFGSWGGGAFVLKGDSYTFINDFISGGELHFKNQDTSYIKSFDPVPEEYRKHFSPAPNGVANYDVVSAFTEGPDGRLWIANSLATDGNYIISVPYNQNGSLNLDSTSWIYFGNNFGISSGISDLQFDDFGRLWIATESNGVRILDYNNTYTEVNDDKIYSLAIEDNLYSQTVTTLAKDQDGIMWIGTAGGLNSYDGLQVYRHVGDVIEFSEDGLALDGYLGSAISNIFVDEFNNKWIASDGGVSILRSGKSAFEPGAWIGYNTENSGLLSNNVNSIFVDSKRSDALIATESGISIFTGSFAQIQNTYKNVIAGPNPFLMDKSGSVFTITKLQGNSTVKIYTLSGLLIRNLTADNSGVDGSRAIWDGKDFNGNRVATGIYLYLAYTAEGKAHSGKIAVIKK